MRGDHPGRYGRHRAAQANRAERASRPCGSTATRSSTRRSPRPSSPRSRLERRGACWPPPSPPPLVIDVDHVIAARSARRATPPGSHQRPRSHSLLAAALAGALVAARAGPAHGWATFAALGSHLLHDAGDTAAPTPVLWPLRPARQLGRRRQLAGTLLLTTASAAAGYAASRARARAAACADGGP